MKSEDGKISLLKNRKNSSTIIDTTKTNQVPFAKNTNPKISFSMEHEISIDYGFMFDRLWNEIEQFLINMETLLLHSPSSWLEHFLTRLGIGTSDYLLSRPLNHV